MTNPADGGGKVLVNVSSARSKGAESGKKRSSVQSKNAPDSRSSTRSGSTSIGGGSGGGGAGGGIVTSASSPGGFQSFFRWFRRDESRALARSTSGSQVTPELLDRRVQQPSRSPSASPVATPAAAGGLRESFTRATPPAQTAPAPPSRERLRTPAAGSGDNVSQAASNGTHSSSPSPGPVIDCQNLSKSSSCDSILSTATNGFAFVPPNCYEAVLVASAGGDSGRMREPRTIQPGPYTDSYKRRCWQRDRARELDRKYELTLRKKYRLFPNLPRDSPPTGDPHDATLTRDNQRTVYTDLSLPTRSIEANSNQRNGGAYTGQPEEVCTDPVNRRHRRTVSDSSKDRRAGAYVHVKGKRKAPPPPPVNGTAQDDGSSTGGTLTRSSTSNYGTLSPGSTLSRRKRPAPAPPTTAAAAAVALGDPSTGSSTSLLEDKEIKAIIEGRPLPVHTEEPPRLIMPLPLIRPLSPLPNISEERALPGGLTEEQKQQLIDNIRKVQSQTAQQQQQQQQQEQQDDPCDLMKMEERFNRANGTRSPIHDYLYAEAMASAQSSTNTNTGTAANATATAGAAPTSPISPRPWYKRPISGMRHQDSSLPFKRDVILRTLDKRKGSQAAGGTAGPSKDPCDDLPEVGYHRNSLLQPAEGPSGSNGSSNTSPASSLGARGGGGGKFNLFSKITEKVDSEKRRSAIGIPSISELDREAAEIIQSERAAAREVEKPKSTKELISKFEATSTPVVGKVTVNSTFVAKKEYFGVEPQKKLTAQMDSPQQIPPPTVVAPVPEKTPEPSKASGVTSDKNLLGLWMCPYCTLENPNWRIICEACERIKPYDSALSILEEPPLHPNHPLKRPIPNPAEPKRTIPAPVSDDTWDRKQERVLKYFIPKPSTGPATNGTLLVGATDNGSTGLPNRKPSFGQTKLLASPKMGVKSLMSRGAGQDVATPSTSAGSHRHFNGIAASEVHETTTTTSSNKFDDEKLKESGNGFVAAPLASPEPTEDVIGSDRINLEEIRSARIARFGVVPDTDTTSSSAKRDDQRPSEQPQPDALEREKERLREMIRAMNAKALAERYPVVQKPPTANSSSSAATTTTTTSSSSNSLKRDSPLVQRKNGLTSGIPISTKSSSPLPRRKIGSPMMARRAASPAPPTPEEPATRKGESNPTGAIRKTTAFVLQPPSESKIMNHDTTRNHAYGPIPETVLELNQTLAAPAEPESGPSLVLTNDVQAMHYEPMDEQQFVRSTATPARQPGDSAIPLSPRLQDRHRKTLMEKQQQHDEKVRQISDQLRSQQGVDRFRSTLALYPGANMGRTGTLALNKLLRNLEQAISEGAHDRAAELAMDLAKMKVSLSVTRQSSPGLGDISLKVYIDDKVSHKGPLRVVMATLGTLGQLKQKMCNEYQLPVAVQRWRCDDRQLEDDGRTLLDYGIQTNDQTLHVYLVQPPQAPAVTAPACFNRTESKLLAVVSSESSDGEHSDTQNDDATVLGATALPKPTPRSSRPKEATIAEEPLPSNEEGWTCPVCTLINEPDRPGCAACSGSRPASYIPPSARRRLQTTTVTVTPEDLKRFLDEQPPLARPVPPVAVQLRSPPLETRNDLNRISSNRKSSDIFNILLDESKATGASGQPAAATPPVPKPRTATDLVRPVHIQVPEQSRIVMTALTSHRSPNITRSQYRGVDNFNPNSSGLPKPERPIITTASPIVRAVLLKQQQQQHQQQPVRFGRNGLALPEDGTEVMQNHYTELVNLDNADLIANIEPFECPICFGPFQPYEGIVLRDCLHSFCKQCLISTIQYSDEAEIRCPYSDAVYSCESVIQQREIKALVSKELYEAHLAKSIQQAESKIDNTFHCRTPNCRGWCIYEDNVNQFKCPVCTIVNCLTCRVIHDGLDCKQYQDRMNSDCDTNLEARRTKAMLQEMIEKGDALNCPTCQVIVMKKWGCDWLKCSMCKTEICWVTRGARWGPAGKGDTSGGCRCGVNGIKCHPKCNYCH